MMLRYASMWVSYLTSMMLLVATAPTAASDLQIVNNGFEGVLVVIDPMINETYAKGIDLLQAIKNTVTEGSQALFEATENRAFFRKVTIIIPNTWENTDVETEISFNKKDGHIHIQSSNPKYKHQPYTEQTFLECGKQGDFIHLTPIYLTERKQVRWWGKRGKNLAIEWAKFRWGIFDEIGYPGDPVFPFFYQGLQSIEPNICNDTAVKGFRYDVITKKRPCKYNDDGSPDENCRFRSQRNNVKSSLLSYAVIKNKVSLFCNESSHNKMAPTKQNDYCGKRSAWSVIMDHEDFKYNRNVPITEKEEIEFQIVKPVNYTTFILVLDYSGSMDTADRIIKLHATTQRWILYDVKEGNYVAIVKFTDSAYTLQSPIKINSSNRKSIANKIDANAGGGTNIDSGVQEALRILGGRPNCVIFVLTDGEDSNPIDPNSYAKAAGCRANSITFGPSADEKLEEFSKRTDGDTFNVDDGNTAEEFLKDAFTSTSKYQSEQDPLSQIIKIHEAGPYSGSDTKYTNTFSIDKRMSRNLELRIMSNNFNYITTPPVLIAPNGMRYETTAIDSASKVWIVQVETVMRGTWQYEVGLSGNSDNFISSTVTCQPKEGGELPITISSKTSAPADGVDLEVTPITIISEVKQGNNPVVGAEVIALVTSVNNPTINLKLLDNGNGADAIKGDGIYSRYLTGIKAEGRLSIKIKVKETYDSLILRTPKLSTRRKREATLEDDFHVPNDLPEPCCGSYVPIDRFDTEPTGDFNRIESAGSVKITNVPPIGSDTFAPIRVRDLTVKSMEVNSNQEKGLLHYTTLTWTAPGDDFDNGIVEKYSLRFSQSRADLSEDSFSSATEYPLPKELYSDIFQEAGSTIFLNISLESSTFTEGVPYYFSLKAQDEKNNESPASNIVKVIVPRSTPFITITSTTSSSIHITWTSNIPIISKYDVTWSSHSDESINVELGPDANSLGIKGIRCNTEYTITVTAQSDQDIKNWANSDSVNVTTYDTAPGTPIIEKIYPNEDHTKLLVQWSEAKYRCSGGLRNYHITWKTNNHTVSNGTLVDMTDNGTSYKYTISNVLLDSTYNVTVAARSYSGIEGPIQSQTVDTIPSDMVPPSRVEDLRVEIMKRNYNQESGLVHHTTFTWTAPGDDYDTGIVDKYSLRFSRSQADLSEDSFSSATGYRISKELYSNIFVQAGSKISLKISLDVPRFIEGLPYYFALNAQDELNNKSPASNIVEVILPVPTPSVTITNTTSSSLHITWTGNSPSITNYDVTWASNSDNSITIGLVSDDNSLEIRDLRCNTEYTITVTAQSDQDIKNWTNSDSVNATTYDTAPGTPMIEKIYPNEDHTKLLVQWSEAKYSCSGGLRNYHITWKTNNHTLNNHTLHDTTDNGTTCKYTISNVLLDSTYNVTVRAKSDTGILGPMHSKTVDTIRSESWTPGRWILCNCDFKKNYCETCYLDGVPSKAKEQP